MRELIKRLSTRRELKVIERDQSWELRIAKPDDLVFEVIVPNEVLEWFVAVKQVSTGNEVWSDWIDYYATESANKTNLSWEMASDVETFVERLLVSPVRLVDSRAIFGSRKRLEWGTNHVWEKVSLV